MIGLYQQMDPPSVDEEPESSMVEIKCMTQQHFAMLREIEYRTQASFKRAISDSWLMRLTPGIMYPIIDANSVSVHYGPDSDFGEVTRVRAMLTATETVWVDMPTWLYNDLPKAEAASTILAMLSNNT